MDTSKIIKGAVSSGRYTVTAPIVKEDYGLYLQIEGVELPQTYEVDFSNSEHSGTSVTMIGNSDGVLIPSQFISSGKDIFAFLYHVGEDFGRTVYKFRIPNKLRPDRTEETPTPEEQSVIDQAINALNEAVAQTAEDVIDADASAQSAQGYAEQAESARDNAQTYANNAQASATSASQSATASANSASASAQSASQSAQIKSDVESLADDAQGYAQASAQSASASANSASQAQGFAQSASASAQSASGYSSNAQTSANTASNKATEASTSAQTASQKATESAQSATTASNKASEASGYATASQAAQGLAESARDSAISAKNDAESARDTAQTLVNGITGKVEQIDSNTERIESLEDDRYKPYVVDSASGSIASFSDGADDLPLKSFVVDINPIQDLSNGDPSPENICPISGWTEVDVEQSGENLLDTSFSKWGNKIYLYQKIPWGDKQNITLSLTDNDTNIDISNIYFGASQNEGTYVDGPVTWLVTNGNISRTELSLASYHRYLAVYPNNENTLTKLLNRFHIQLEYGSTATPYSPYTGRSITINLGQTVYGGKLDVLSGELVIDMAMVDLGTLTWTEKVDGVYSTADLVGLTTEPTNYSTVPNIMCSIYTSDSYLNLYSNAVDHTVTVIWSASASHGQLWIRDMTYTDAETFKTAVTGQTLVYELAEPLTIQLTPNEVNSLLGVNNIWADSGDTEVEYRADTKLFIERLTAPDSADMIADANITSGQYFMVGNSLYKATANIANGSAIVVGTNCIRKSLSEALNEINA